MQFWFAFGIAAIASFFVLNPPFDGLVVHLGKVLVVASLCGALAGRFGDPAWRLILNILR